MDTRGYKATPAQLETIAAELKAKGLEFDPTQATGSAIQGDWDIGWAIDAAAETIAISVVKHPFAEEGFFWDAVQKQLGEPV